MKPYYEHAGITIYHADCRDVLPTLAAGSVDLVLTDPPYGLSLKSGRSGSFGDCSVLGDSDTGLRDWLVGWFHGPMIMFGSPNVKRPVGYRSVLVWDKGEHVGMGDLDFPWKPNYEEIYVWGSGFQGRRSSSVLRHLAIAGTVAVNAGRWHPTEKPVSLMVELLGKCPSGTVLDPFLGSGTTLVAAKMLGRRAIGIEISEAYCEIAAKRLSQEVLPLEQSVAEAVTTPSLFEEATRG